MRVDDLIGHEKLRVYRASLEFVSVGDALLALVGSNVAACDHLSRAMEGVPVHIAVANSSWSARERVAFLGHANGSVLECAACLDILVSKRRLKGDQIYAAKSLLSSICGMLIAMERTAASRVCEADDTSYLTPSESFFSHEKLDVYRTALRLVRWVDNVCCASGGRRDLVNRLDESSTGIVLNIAEGNGRFSSVDHARFLGIAHAAGVKLAATLDLLVARQLVEAQTALEGRRLLVRIHAMLTALGKRCTCS
jgi:four helix bundle protein